MCKYRSRESDGALDSEDKRAVILTWSARSEIWWRGASVRKLAAEKFESKAIRRKEACFDQQLMLLRRSWMFSLKACERSLLGVRASELDSLFH